MSAIGKVSAQFRRGEAIAIPLFIESGDISAFPQRKAVLKKALDGPRVPPDAQAGVADFTITLVPAAGDVAEHLLHSIAAAVSQNFEMGIYCFNSAMGSGGAVSVISSPYFFEIIETTTDSVL